MNSLSHLVEDRPQDQEVVGDFDKAIGMVLGFPETAIEAFIGERRALSRKKLPDDVRKSESVRFCDFMLSEDNWQEEIKQGQRYADFIKKVSPKIYQEFMEGLELESIKQFEVEGRDAVVRRASPDDSAAISDIIQKERAARSEREQRPEEQPPEDEALETMRRISDHDNFMMLTCAVEDKVCGYLELSRQGDGSAYINNIEVLKEYQGKGIGKNLLEGCLSEAEKSFGVKNIELYVISGNSKAIALYEKLGFKENKNMRKLGVEQWSGKPADGVTMIKELE